MLEHCLESVAVLCPAPRIEPQHLVIGPGSGRAAGSPHGDAQGECLFSSDMKPLREGELAYIQHVLEACDGYRSAAARFLEIGRPDSPWPLRA